MKTEIVDGFTCRVGTTDKIAVAETRRIFRKPGGPREGDVVLDLGAHIGSFSRRALDVGATTVVAVEAEESNCDMFWINVPDSRALLIQGAVTGTTGEAELYLGSTYGHTLTKPIRHRETVTVPTFALTDILDEVNLDFTFVKIDIEGSEYDLGLPEVLPDSVDRLFIEFHQTFGNRPRSHALRQRIVDFGFSPVWESASRSNMEGVFAR